MKTLALSLAVLLAGCSASDKYVNVTATPTGARPVQAAPPYLRPDPGSYGGFELNCNWQPDCFDQIEIASIRYLAVRGYAVSKQKGPK